MILPIHISPSPVLTTPCQPVGEISDEIRQLAADMRETMHNAQGIGLAAPQVGKSVQLCVLELDSKENDEPEIPFLVLCNPRITWHSTQQISMLEACLSLPDIEGPVMRPESVRVKAKDLDGNEVEIRASGLLSRALQHEIDHLQGKLFTSYVPSKKIKKRRIIPYPTVISTL